MKRKKLKKQTKDILHQNQIHKYYFDHPEIWENLRRPSIEKEITFINFFLRKYSIKKVLDIGCGTGIHCEYLSRLGYETIGVDPNRNMISYAQKHYKKTPFFVGDMRELDKLEFKSMFEAILCLCTTFSYNITNKEIVSVLKNFNKLLKIGGLLIIEVFNPISFLQKITFNGSFFLEDKKKFEEVGLDIKTTHSVDERTQTMFENKKIFDKSGRLLKEDNTQYRLLFPQELQFFLATTGFKTLGQFGKYNRNYKNLDRTRLITVASKHHTL